MDVKYSNQSTIAIGFSYGSHSTPPPITCPVADWPVPHIHFLNTVTVARTWKTAVRSTKTVWGIPAVRVGLKAPVLMALWAGQGELFGWVHASLENFCILKLSI